MNQQSTVVTSASASNKHDNNIDKKINLKTGEMVNKGNTSVNNRQLNRRSRNSTINNAYNPPSPSNVTKRHDLIQQSHLKLLIRNNIQLSFLNNENIAATLDRITLNDGRVPKTNYKVALLNTIRKNNNEVTVTPRQLKCNRDDCQPRQRYFDKHTFTNVILLSQFALSCNSVSANNKSDYNTMLSILLTLLCNPINNKLLIYDLTYAGYENLKLNKSIQLEDGSVLNVACPRRCKIFFTIIDKLLNASGRNTESGIFAKSSDKIITCTTDTINKTLKKILEMLKYENSKLSDSIVAGNGNISMGGDFGDNDVGKENIVGSAINGGDGGLNRISRFGIQKLNCVPRDILYSYLFIEEEGSSKIKINRNLIAKIGTMDCQFDLSAA